MKTLFFLTFLFLSFPAIAQTSDSTVFEYEFENTAHHLWESRLLNLSRTDTISLSKPVSIVRGRRLSKPKMKDFILVYYYRDQMVVLYRKDFKLMPKNWYIWEIDNLRLPAFVDKLIPRN